MNSAHRPVLIVSALLAALGPLVGNGLYSGPSGSGQEILDDVNDGPPAIAYVAYALELVGFAALAVLIGCLVLHVVRPAPVAAVAGGILGSVMLAIKLGSLAPIMVVMSAPKELDANTAKLFVSLNDAAFVVSGMLLGLALLALGLGLLRTDTRRWLAWWLVVASGLGVVTGFIGIFDTDNYVPIPFLLQLVWMVALGVTTALSRGSTRADDPMLVATHAHA